MERQAIAVEKFLLKVHPLWSKQWLLLTSGDFTTHHFNSMTVGWGGFGTMWSKPFVQIVVRPTRYTFEFMEQYDTFTLCAFPPAYQKALQLTGSKSGRDGDKIKATGLTPIPASRIAAPGFAEAELIVECRKIYWDDFNPDQFLDPDTENNYPLKDYHRIYFGEILAISGVKSYSA